MPRHVLLVVIRVWVDAQDAKAVAPINVLLHVIPVANNRAQGNVVVHAEMDVRINVAMHVLDIVVETLAVQNVVHNVQVIALRTVVVTAAILVITIA